MLVRSTHEARREFHALPPAEKEAMRNAVGKLEQVGEELAYPHSSSVRGRRTCASYDHVPAGVPGGPSIGGLAPRS